MVAVATVVAGSALAQSGVATTPGLPGVAVTVLVVAVALWPEYAPRPRRSLDRLRAVSIRVGLAIGALGFAGGLGVGLVPAPVLLAVVGVTTAITVPILLNQLRRIARSQRVVLAGDDAGKLGDSVAALETRPLGHVSPPRLSLASAAPDSLDVERLRTDGGVSRDEQDSSAGQETTAAQNADSRRQRQDRAGAQRGEFGRSTRERDGGEDATELDPSTEPHDRIPADDPTTERISGLSELQTLLVSRDVDAVVLGFSTSDRQEFFGALRVCREQGVDAKVHPFHAPSTLIDEGTESGSRDARPDSGGVEANGGDRSDGGNGRDEGQTDASAATSAIQPSTHQQILDANVDPLPPHSRVAKRGFDVCFATLGLVALAPLMLVIGVAIKLDSPGPVLYGQSRTTRLGRVFTLWKFRSMTDGAERDTGPTLSDEDAGDVDARVTRVGAVLRATHLDEIPQLLSVLNGDMTVVGPRPERPELEAEIAADGVEWERRWFVKPGLTGLAQINEITGFQPAEKLAHDLEYVERQSLALDVRIVLEQLRQVAADGLELLRSGEPR
ncbi:hypothetical protein GCM10028857_14040 [Salinarchaeum chitinilyticum]